MCRAVDLLLKHIHIRCARTDLVLQRFKVGDVLLDLLQFGIIARSFFGTEYHRYRIAACHAVPVRHKRHKRACRIGTDVAFIAYHKALHRHGVVHGGFQRDLGFNG